MRDLPIRLNDNLKKETSPADKRQFKDFYKIVAKCLGMTNAVINEYDRVIQHTERLEVSILNIHYELIYLIIVLFILFFTNLGFTTMAY